MVVGVLSAASNTFELLAAPDEDSLPTQVWYIAYVYGPYAAWAFFFLTLILLM